VKFGGGEGGYNGLCLISCSIGICDYLWVCVGVGWLLGR